MINGVDTNGNPSKTLEEKMQDVFNKNPEYKYIDLVYKPNGKTINMRYATLIVEDGYQKSLSIFSGSDLEDVDIDTLNNALYTQKRTLVRGSKAYHKVNDTHKKIKRLINN